MSTPNPVANMIASAVPLNKFLGFTSPHFETGKVSVRVENPPLHRNHVGSMHAAILFGVAEAASGATLLGSLLDLMGKIYPVVKGARIEYAAAARGPVIATGELPPEKLADIKQRALDGEKVDLHIPVTVRDEETGREVAKCVFDWAIRPARR